MSKNAQRNLDLFILTISIIPISFFIYIIYRISLTEHKIFSISFIALLAGVLFESFRITDNWKTVIYIFISALFCSFISFYPGEHEYYEFENHLEVWPYFFVFFFAGFSTMWNREIATSKLTEGITLLQTISIIYWIFDYGIVNIDGWFIRILLIVVLLFSLLSLFNALTHLALSRTIRVALSIWSTIIMVVFAVDYIYRVYQNGDTETSIYLSQGLYIGIQFFLLGISIIYIIQNFAMLIGFLPSKQNFFNTEYFRIRKELINDHIERYSDQQVQIRDSIICILLTGTFYWLNFKYQYLPRDTAIWIGFVFVPIILRLPRIIRRK